MTNKLLLKIIVALILSMSFIKANNNIIAEANGEKITLEELATATNNPSLTKEKILSNKNAYINFLNKMIGDKLVRQLIFEKNLVSDLSVEKQFKIKKFSIINTKFKNNLLSQININKQEIEKFYAKNKSKMISPAQYKVLFIVFKDNNIESKDFLNDVKNSQDKVAFLNKNNATETVITKRAFPDKESFNEFRKIKKGKLGDNLIKVGQNYMLFYVMDIQKETKLPLSQMSKQIEKFLVEQKLSKKYNDLLTSLKEKATISFSSKHEPTVNGFKWDLITIKENFVWTGITKNFKLVKKDNMLPVYLRISDKDRQTLIDTMIGLPLIYDYAMQTTYKNDQKIKEYFKKVHDDLKIKYWLKKEVSSDKKLGKSLYKFKMISSMQNVPIIDAINKLIKAKKESLGKDLIKQVDVKIYIDQPYSNTNKTTKHNMKTEDTIIKECIATGDQFLELKKLSDKLDYDAMDKIDAFFDKCKKPSFSKIKVKRNCYRFYKKKVGRSSAKKETKKNEFCKFYLF